LSVLQELNSINFECPPVDDETSLGDWCIACTFRMLSLDIIITLFAALLLEQRIVLVCNNLGVLSAIALSFIPLIRPYVWQGVFIPILPHCLLDCLDAPVPFVLGMQAIPENRVSQMEEILVIDIENNTATLPKEHFEGIPFKKKITS